MKVLAIASLAALLSAASSPAPAEGLPDYGMSPRQFTNPADVAEVGDLPMARGDCVGKRPGDVFQVTTPKGIVVATCQATADGLVAKVNYLNGPQRHF